MVDAITQSCNVYFYQLGRKVGIEKWSAVLSELGFGQKTEIDLYGEVTGNHLSPEFYVARNIAYSPGMILNLAIGQGENDVTPLQLARYVGIIATEGIITQPHLLKGNTEPPKRMSSISRESFKVVKRGMCGVINDVRGTAKNARIPDHFIAGKTGTVQNPHGTTHKVFVAFAPYDDPQIAVACIAENCGEITPSLAVLIVKHVLTEYFNWYPDPTTAQP